MSSMPNASVLADVWYPATSSRVVPRQVLLVGVGALVIALGAQVAFPLPFTPVPVTLQTLAVLLVGVVLGSRRGALAAAVYVVGGACGLPLFAAGGLGLVRLLGPTGGYLLGFIAAAFVVGWLAEHGCGRNIWTAMLAMLAGTVVLYAIGLPWLAFYVGSAHVVALGLLPFIPGAIVKLALAVLLLPTAWRFTR